MRAASIKCYLEKFRSVPPEELYDKAMEYYEPLLGRFNEKKDCAMKNLPTKVRRQIERESEQIAKLPEKESHEANRRYRRIYARLNLREYVRDVEEVTTAYTASLSEKLDLCAAGKSQLEIIRHMSDKEAVNVAEKGVLEHKCSDQNFLSFAMCWDPTHEDEEAWAEVDAASVTREFLRVVDYRSKLFSAPGRKADRREQWCDDKLWDAGSEAEVRLLSGMPITKLGIKIYLKVVSADEINRRRKNTPYGHIFELSSSHKQSHIESPR